MLTPVGEKPSPLDPVVNDTSSNLVQSSLGSALNLLSLIISQVILHTGGEHASPINAQTQVGLFCDGFSSNNAHPSLL